MFGSAVDLVDRQDRREVSIRGYAARENGETAEVLIVNLSYDGCAIAIPMELLLGEVLKLAVSGRAAMPSLVAWYSAGKAGLVFKSDVEETKGQKLRKSDRIILNAEATTRRLGRARYRVRVFDLSPEGCRIEIVERPQLGEVLIVKFIGIDALDGRVCWVDSRCAGVRFANPIHPAVFDLLVARTGAAALS